MNEVLTLLGMTAVMHGGLYYLRFKHFYRKPEADQGCGVYSPVEGRVVYIRHHKGHERSDVSIDKQYRKLGVPSQVMRVLDEGTPLTQIGIFMSPYNNHHVCSSVAVGQYYHPSMITEGTELNSMTDWKESVFLWKWWRNWFEKKASKFIDMNQHTLWDQWFHGCRIWHVLIYDKYVNKLTEFRPDRKEAWTTDGRRVYGFVHRGSQVDMFIPTGLIERSTYGLQVKVGDRVNFNTQILGPTQK